jgi:hypothetical protein
MPKQTPNFDRYVRLIDRSTAELRRFVEDVVRGDFAKLRIGERAMQEGLVRRLLELPWVEVAGAGFVLDLTQRGAIDEGVRRLFEFIDDQEAAIKTAMRVSTFSNTKLPRAAFGEMVAVNAMAKRHWSTALSALKNPELFPEAVFAEAKQLITTQRRLQRKISVVLKRQVSWATAGKASNVFALIGEA